MSLLNFFRKKTSDTLFVNTDSFESNLKNQLKMTPQTLHQLRKLGVGEEKELRLEYFFYTDSFHKAKRFSKELQSLGYEVEQRPSAGHANLFVITGWTNNMKMSDE